MVLHKVNKKKKSKTVIAVILIVAAVALLMLFFSPYIKAEYLTARHGQEFEGLELKTNMLDEAKYLKVLKYRNGHAKVLYVGDGYRCLFCFDGYSDEWKCSNWNCIWSSTGSADNFLFMVLYQ